MNVVQYYAVLYACIMSEEDDTHTTAGAVLGFDLCFAGDTGEWDFGGDYVWSGGTYYGDFSGNFTDIDFTINGVKTDAYMYDSPDGTHIYCSFSEQFLHKPARYAVSGKFNGTQWQSGDFVWNDDGTFYYDDDPAPAVEEPTTAADEPTTIKQTDLPKTDDGNNLSTGALMGTGAVVYLLDADGSGIILDQYTVIVMGDANGDGKITAADVRLTLRASAQLENLEGVYFAAANVNKAEKLSASAARKILRVSSKLETL